MAVPREHVPHLDRSAVLVAERLTAPAAVGFAQQRPDFRQGETEFEKTAVTPLDHGQSRRTILRVAAVVDSGFADLPHFCTLSIQSAAGRRSLIGRVKVLSQSASELSGSIAESETRSDLDKRLRNLIRRQNEIDIA